MRPMIRFLVESGFPIAGTGSCLLCFALAASEAWAQPAIGERVEVAGQVVQLNRNELRIQSGAGLVNVSLGLERVELPGGFLSEPGRVVEFEIAIRETTEVLLPGQYVQFQTECDPLTLIPTGPLATLRLLPDQRGIKSSWRAVAEDGREAAAADDAADDAADTSDEAAEFERRVAEYEVIGLIQKIDATALTLKVGTRRVRVPTDEETVVALEATDPTLLRPGDQVEVVGRQVGPLVLATRIRARRVAPSLVAVLERREQAERGGAEGAAEAPAAPSPMVEPAKILGGRETPPAELREGPAPAGKYFGRRLKIN